MKTLSLLRALAALFLLTLTLGAAVPSAQAPAPLPALSGTDRAALVQQFRDLSTASILWGEYYATTPAEHSYWAGKADAFNVAAQLLETQPATAPVETRRGSGRKATP